VKNIIRTAALNAVLTVVYVIAVAFFMYSANQAKFGSENTILIPMVLLLLFVFSASLTGFLILGRPALWYIDGKKKEALSLLANTLGIFFAFTFVAILLLMAYTVR